MSMEIEIQDKLTEAFINYQWRLENPMPSHLDEELMHRAWVNNPIFRNRVKSLVAGVFDIVSPYIKGDKMA